MMKVSVPEDPRDRVQGDPKRRIGDDASERAAVIEPVGVVKS